MQQSDFSSQYLKRLITHTVRKTGFFDAHDHIHPYSAPGTGYLCLIGNSLDYSHVKNPEIGDILQKIEKGLDVPHSISHDVDKLARYGVMLVEMRYAPGHDAETDTFYRFVPHGIRLYDQNDELDNGLYIDDLFTRMSMRQLDGKNVLHAGGREMTVPDLFHILNRHNDEMTVDAYYRRILGARIAARRDLCI